MHLNAFTNDMLSWNKGEAFVLMSPISSCFPAGLTHMIWTGLNDFAVLHNKLSSLTRCSRGQQASSHVTLICFFLFCCAQCSWLAARSLIISLLACFGHGKKKTWIYLMMSSGGEEVAVAFCELLSPRVRRVLLSLRRRVELSRVYLFARSWCLKTEDVQFAEGILRQTMVVLGASSPACWYRTPSLCQGTVSWRAWCLLYCSFTTHCSVRTAGSTGALVIFLLTPKPVLK